MKFYEDDPRAMVPTDNPPPNQIQNSDPRQPHDEDDKRADQAEGQDAVPADRNEAST